MNGPILQVEGLKKYFPITSGILRRQIGEVKAVDDISFSINEGEILGVVGESGSGKSTLARAAIRLLEPTEGSISFLGTDILALSDEELRSIRTRVQMVFQDPYASLNPRKNIGDSIGEALLYHKIVGSQWEQRERVAEVLNRIGLPANVMDRYPHQFSGGQQQRICIGRAIAMNPRLIICDEAVSALDLSVQAQILNLLFELKETLQLSYLFISHDLSVVRYLCDRVLVMYGGKVVEEGLSADIFENPQHPYTKALIAAIPSRRLHSASSQ